VSDSDSEFDSDSDPDAKRPPTWAALFARGETVETTETEVRETLRSRRDA
jgi:hypothetical protein